MPPPPRLLFVQLKRLGDVVLSTALVEDLRRQLPDARIDWLVGAAAAPLLMHNPNIDERIIFRPERLPSLVREVRRRRYDLLIDVQANPRTAILSMLSGIPVRVGWAARFWRVAYSRTTPRDTEPVYTVRDRRRLLRLAGIEPGDGLPRLYLSEEERQRGAGAARQLGVDAEHPAIGLAISTHDPERDWRTEGFARVAELLAAEGFRVLVFRFPGDDEVIARFRDETGAGEVVEWSGDRDFLALLDRCAALVSPNTGPAHMATALGVPRVTLYGSTSPLTWSPDLPIVASLTNPRRPCLGCRRAYCPVDRECIRGIRPDEVVASVKELLERVGVRELPGAGNQGSPGV